MVENQCGCVDNWDGGERNEMQSAFDNRIISVYANGKLDINLLRKKAAYINKRKCPSAMARVPNDGIPKLCFCSK